MYAVVVLFVRCFFRRREGKTETGYFLGVDVLTVKNSQRSSAAQPLGLASFLPRSHPD